MFKKLLLATALTLSVSSNTYASGFPMTDIIGIAQDVWESFQRHSEHLIDKAMSETKLDTIASNAEMEIDTWNNGAANYIARINQAYSDIFNLKQSERSAPAPGACTNMILSESLDDALCNQLSTTEQINQIRSKIMGGVSGVATASIDGVDNMRLASSGANSETKSEAEKALDLYYAEVTKHLRNLDRHIDEGRREDVENPGLTMIFDSSPYEFTDDQLDIAISRNFLETPPFVNKSRQDPMGDKELAILKRNLVLHNTAADVAVKNIALKTKGENDFPSKLKVMDMAAKIRLYPDVSMTGQDESFLQGIVMKNAGEGASSREEVLMYSIRLNNEMEKYKQLLALERQIINYGQIKLMEKEGSEVLK